MRHRTDPASPSGRRRRRTLMVPVASALLVVGGSATAAVVLSNSSPLEAELQGSGAVVEAPAAPAAFSGGAGAGSTRAVEGPSGARVAPGRRAQGGAGPFTVVQGTRLVKLPPPPPEPTPAPRRAPTPGGGAGALARAAEDAASGSVPSFLVASFNVLGSQHTFGSNQYASGATRALSATRFLQARAVSVVGFSELQGDQLGVFQRNAPGWGVYPGTSAGGAGIPQSVAWDTAVWTLQEARTFSIVFSGQVRPQPVVRLRNTITGTDIWVVNVHNSPQDMEAERDRAMAVEVSVIQGLAQSGVPIVMTGDFNEKEEALCRFTSSTLLLSAVGGSGCTAPPGARVDWIFAGPEFTVESYLAERASPVPSITDHAVMLSRLSIS